MNNSSESAVNEPAGTRSIDDVDAETKKISTQVFDIIAVKGKASMAGPGVSSCGEQDREKFFKMRHPWSVTGSSNEELKKAMTRLKEELPKQGWEIVSYGPNTSRNKSLELLADHTKEKFAVNVVLMEQHNSNDDPPLLAVSVVSACYQVPAGERVDRY